jgi:hypothetical protein
VSHARKIDHQTAVSQSTSGPIVSTAAHGQREVVFASNMHCRLHVFHGLAERKHGRLMIDCAVPDLPNSGVGVLASHYDVPRHDRAKIVGH